MLQEMMGSCESCGCAVSRLYTHYGISYMPRLCGCCEYIEDEEMDNEEENHSGKES